MGSAQTKKKESFYGIGTVYVRPFLMINGEKVFQVDQFSDHNLIVKEGRGSLIDLLIGFKKMKLGVIRWGKGGAPAFPDGDPLQPYPVNDTDISVATFLLDKTLGPYNRISRTQVEYVETLISDEVNDDVNEAAMMFVHDGTGDLSIFARITFPTVRLLIEKGSGIELKWVFDFEKAEETTV